LTLNQNRHIVIHIESKQGVEMLKFIKRNRHEIKFFIVIILASTATSIVNYFYPLGEM